MQAIKTSRCTLRRFAKEDLEDFMAYRNDMQWMQYQGFKGLSQQEYETELLGEAQLEQGLQLAVVNSTNGKLLGDVYLKREDDAIWLGYTIAPTFARNGYAAEAVEGIIAWAKQQGAACLKAGVLPQNKASVGLLQKLGFACTAEEGGELVYALVLNNTI